MAYTNLSRQDRTAVDEIAHWLQPINWQFFVTLTFPWNVRAETADAKLKAWLNALERDLKTRVCFIAGKECKPHSHGVEVPWHFHVLVASMVEIPKELMEGLWLALIGRANQAVMPGESQNEHVLVLRYEPGELGHQYCLKALNSSDGDWQFRWIELFNPRIPCTARPNHRTERNQTRFVQQQRRIVGKQRY